jgi:glycosyltransferase involved in cell wall biosynthesis
MACSKPVVSSNLPTGVSYVNQNRITGLLVEPRSSIGLAKAINKLLKNKRLAIKYGEAGQRRVKGLFTRETMVNSIINIYKKLPA